MTRDFSTRPRRAPRVGGVLFVVVGVLAVALSAYRAVQDRRAWARETALAEKATEDLGQLQERIRSLQAAQGLGDQTLVSRIALSAQAPPRALLAELGKALPADVRLIDMTLFYGQQLAVEMHIEARRPEAYDEFLSRLGQSASFHDIVPGAESREGAVQATVKARFGGP